jgi:hypothetical protein
VAGNPLGMSPEQLSVAQQSVAQVIADGLPPRAAEILLMTEDTESGVRNLNYGDRDSAGVLQQRPSQGWGTFAQVTNVPHAVQTFLSRLVQVPGWSTKSPWLVAQAVQRSAYSDGSNYQRNWSDMATLADQLYAQGGGKQPVSGAGAAPAPGGGGAITAEPAGIGSVLLSPAPWLNVLVPGAGLLVDGLSGKAAGSLQGEISKFVASAALKLLLVGSGAALVVAGIYHTTQGPREAAANTIEQAAPLAAAAA